MGIDVQQQWRELEETYSNMADEESSLLASQAYELTDLAKQALQRDQVKHRRSSGWSVSEVCPERSRGVSPNSLSV
jgi:hypothetical protein